MSSASLIKCLLSDQKLPQCEEHFCTYCAAVSTGIATQQEVNNDNLKLAKAALHRWGQKSHHRYCSFFKERNSCDCGFAEYTNIMKALFDDS